MCSCGVPTVFNSKLKQNEISHTITINFCNEALMWLERVQRMISGVMQSVVLPCNGAVVLGKVYKVDGKGHGAHCQHVDNFEGWEPHLGGDNARKHKQNR